MASGSAERTRTMICPVCDTGVTIDAGEARDRVHCADCGSLLRDQEQRWSVGEIGWDTDELIEAVRASDVSNVDE